MLRRMNTLEHEMERLLKDDPAKIKNNPRAKLYMDIVKALEKAAENPVARQYLLGNTLGKDHRDWRRIKEGLPQRYRLLFKFFSAVNEVYFVWINDESTLRNDGAKTDCYAVFRKMLDGGIVPSTRHGLAEGSIEQ